HDAFDLFVHEQNMEPSEAVKKAAELLGLGSDVHERSGHGAGAHGECGNAKGARARRAFKLRRLQPYRAFPVDLLPLSVARFVKEGAASLGCDAAFYALPLLSAAGACIGNSRRVLVKQSWTEPAVLWTALVVPSGGGRTPRRRRGVSRALV